MGAKKPYTCANKYTFGVGGAGSNAFSADVCVDDQITISPTANWVSKIFLANTPVVWWPYHGLVGASLGSDLVKTHRVFSLVPSGDRYEMYVGRVHPKTRQCAYIGLSGKGLTHNKWIVRGSMESVGLRDELEFEVDTGFPPLAMTRQMFNQFRAKFLVAGAGTFTGAVSSGYAHHADRCDVRKIPAVKYTFADTKAGVQYVHTIPGEHFVKAMGGGKCTVLIMVLDKLAFGYSYLGVPFLRSVVSRFDSVKKRVGFCDN